MDKLQMHTPNLANENFDKLASLFPNAVTETIDPSTGETVRAIDKDILMQEISAHVVEGREERYQFTWPDKKKAILTANAPIAATLRPVRTDSVGRDGTPGGWDSQNLYIEGDNLDVLKLLVETYFGRVKYIYIDPPYNTGHDFVYHDDFHETEAEYRPNSGLYDEDGNLVDTYEQNTDANGRFHTDWLNMIYPRLVLAKRLLADNGLIFISINEGEQASLEKMCDEVFGASNHVATFVWKNKYGPGAFTRGVAYLHEYILCYAKKYPDNIEASLSEEEIAKYKTFDERAAIRGGYITQPLATKSKDDRPNLVYPLIHNGVEIWPEKQWIWEKSRLYAAYQRGEIVINEHDGKYSVRFKQYLRDENGEIRKGKPLSIITSCFNQDGTKEIQELIGRGVFDFPKPTELIRGLIDLRINENEDKDFIVLDFFSGSASTAHAVMQLNATDGGNRRFIMVQLPETTPKGSQAEKAGYKTICEIGKERIRRAGQKIKEEAGMTASDLDIGFRCFRLDSSNMQDVYYNPEATSQDLLAFTTDNIKPDRTPEDLLYQVMLDLGVELSAKVEETEIDGKKVFNVADGFLLACFDDGITVETVTAIAREKPYYAVFRDSSMENDSAATNVDQIFETYSPATVRKVL